jgi:outer membrane protein
MVEQGFMRRLWGTTGLTAASGALLLASFLLGTGPVSAQESLQRSLARAYGNNPELNAQRANVRAVDELVPQALSGFRPRVTGAADVGRAYFESVNRATPGRARGRTSDAYSPRGVGLQVDQTLFNGFRTENQTRAAESRVLGARETLRNTEQTVLFNGVTAYMNVLRDTAILNLQRNNVEVIEEQLRQTNDRFRVGEVTRTDVAQSEARLALARANASVAQGNLRASIATFRQRIGVEPKRLNPANPIENLLPRSLDAAVAMGLREHPAIIAALHGVDSQQLQVKVVEGELLPTIGLSGSLARRWETQSSDTELYSASLVARLSVPIYEGGQTYSRVREAKETLGERRIQVDQQRDVVRQAVVASWSSLESIKDQIRSAQAGVRAAETALAGVREEARVGQRTTLDVLNAQQELLNARVTLITAQRDRVVASYSVLASVGRLSARTLALNTVRYDPSVHYGQVRDKWIGLNTPDGR